MESQLAGRQAILEREFAAPPFGNLYHQFLICSPQSLRTRQGNRLRYERNKHDCGNDRHYRGKSLNDSGEQIRTVPDCPYLHQVSRATTQDEKREHPEDPIEWKVTTLANQVHQSKRNAEVGEGDQAVRNHVQPDDPWVPQVAIAVRHKLRRKQPPQELQNFCLPRLYILPVAN